LINRKEAVKDVGNKHREIESFEEGWIGVPGRELSIRMGERKRSKVGWTTFLE